MIGVSYHSPYWETPPVLQWAAQRHTCGHTVKCWEALIDRHFFSRCVKAVRTLVLSGLSSCTIGYAEQLAGEQRVIATRLTVWLSRAGRAKYDQSSAPPSVCLQISWIRGVPGTDLRECSLLPPQAMLSLGSSCQELDTACHSLMCRPTTFRLRCLVRFVRSRAESPDWRCGSGWR